MLGRGDPLAIDGLPWDANRNSGWAAGIRTPIAGTKNPSPNRWTTAQREKIPQMVGREGIEPATLGLKVPCSTN